METEETPKIEENKIDDKEVIENITFFSSPIRFNSTMFHGLKLILKKLDKIEAKLNNAGNN